MPRAFFTANGRLARRNGKTGERPSAVRETVFYCCRVFTYINDR